MKNPKKTIENIGQARGFALVVTLTLMVLLSILALGMLSLSSVAIRSSGISASNQIARANARMAMLLALGEIQTYLGPDARTSARAETLAKDTRVGGSVSPNTPEAWWVGVSHSDGVTKLTPPGKDVQWLVSGLSDGKFGGALTHPVKMIGAGSLDLATFTGGKDIEAGRVPVKNDKGKVTGSYAWFVDDNGMKAQLRPADPRIHNSNPTNPSGGVLAASYDPSILTGLGSLNATTQQLQKTGRNVDFEFLGLTRPVIRSKFFSYTPYSLGVLSDTKKGGLKKDLTIAFENPTVFSNVFPSGNPDKFLLVDPLKRPSDLTNGGYINWAIFRDYYNLKKWIKPVGGMPTLAPVAFEKDGLLENAATTFHKGQLGPHQMGSSAPSQHSGHPYGDFGVSATSGGDPSEYRRNPIFPILGAFQQNAWLTKQGPTGTPATYKLISHVQMFTSHYNPYNVALNVYGNNNTAGPRVIKYPQVLFTLDGKINREYGLNSKLQAHVNTQVLIQPGRSQALGFRTDAAVGGEIDGALYTTQVGTVVAQSVKREHSMATDIDPTSNVKMTVEFALPEPALMAGLDEEPGNKEVSQVFFAPFGWDAIAGASGMPGGQHPGKKYEETFPASELGINHMHSLGFYLRTTTEAAGKIRPLVDGNIRAVWNNPRWDAGMNLNILSTYSDDFQGKAPSKLLQFKTEAGNTAFTFWGNKRSQSGANDRIILFDVPRRDLVSLGQLQHAAAGRFSYEPTYIVGNSYANPRIPLGDWKASVSDTYSTAERGIAQWKIGGSFNLYDASYLVNEAMFDSFIFTTIPQQADNYQGTGEVAANYPSLLARTIQLPNPRFIPYEPKGSTFSMATLQAPGTATTGSFYHNAGHLVVDGAFNVNSTSVDAWEAFLTGTAKLPVGKITTSGAVSGYTQTQAVRFPRAASNAGEAMSPGTVNDNIWTGFRELSQPEVREIATEVVKQIKERGPFLTLGSFVNRSLDSGEKGKSGTLQAALDKTVNQKIGTQYQDSASGYSQIPADAGQAAAFPGFLQQGDVLQSLAPYMSVRSDTFTIRAYGEAKNPANEITATAWCEAVVQRVPDPVTPEGTSAKSDLEELALPSSAFGRKFRIISFRWLHPEEV